MAKVYKGIQELIGNTPLVEAVNLEKKLGLKATLLLKLEYFNPAGSVKDRIANGMIEDAEKKGLLKEGATIIEPTSGNTGIGLAAIAAAKGYKAIFRKKKYFKSLWSGNRSDSRRKGNVRGYRKGR